MHVLATAPLGLLWAADRDLLASLVEATTRRDRAVVALREAERARDHELARQFRRDVRQAGQDLVAFGVQLGLSPASRARLGGGVKPDFDAETERYGFIPWRVVEGGKRS